MCGIQSQQQHALKCYQNDTLVAGPFVWALITSVKVENERVRNVVKEGTVGDVNATNCGEVRQQTRRGSHDAVATYVGKGVALGRSFKTAVVARAESRISD